MKVVFPLLLLACVCSLPAKALWTLQVEPREHMAQISMRQAEQSISLGLDVHQGEVDLDVKSLNYQSGQWSVAATRRQLSSVFPSLTNRSWESVSFSHKLGGFSFVEAGSDKRGLVFEWPRFSFALLDMGSLALENLYIPYQRTMQGKTFLFSFHETQSLASLSFEQSFSPSQGLHLVSSLSLCFGPFSYHKTFDDNRWQRYTSFELQCNLGELHILWFACTALGPRPLFGGEMQRLEHTYASHIGFDLAGCELLFSWQQKRGVGITSEHQILLSLTARRITIEVEYGMGKEVSIRLGNGTSFVQYSKQGLSYHLEVAQGSVMFRFASHPNQLSILYRFTTGRDTGSPQPR